MRRLALATALALVAAPALAHTGHGDVSGLMHGLMHPLTGPDHLLAMLAVGLWSGFVIPQRFWLGAATFLSAMAAGAALSWSGIALPAVETLIVASVIAFGLLLGLSRNGQAASTTSVSLAAIGLFAACHGHAHASEATGGAAAYLAGFLISTAGLHVIGIGLARLIAASDRSGIAQKLIGGGVALSGLWLMAS